MDADMLQILKNYLKEQDLKLKKLYAEIKECEQRQTWIVKNRDLFDDDECYYNELCENGTRKTLAIIKASMIERDYQQICSLLNNGTEVKEDDD